MKNNALVYLIAMLAFGITCVAEAISNDNTPTAIEARIQPVGEVKVAAPAAKTATAASPSATKPKQTAMTGETIYNKHCSVCHTPGIAGAPKMGDNKTWLPRMKKGLDGMLKKATSGFNAMPPKGTCVNCTEQQLKEAIKYMLPKKT